MSNMYVSSVGNNIQENAKKAKILALFNTLEENDKDIVIAMMESLNERNKDTNMADMTTIPVVTKRHLTVHVNWIIASKPETFTVLKNARWAEKNKSRSGLKYEGEFYETGKTDAFGRCGLWRRSG